MIVLKAAIATKTAEVSLCYDQVIRNNDYIYSVDETVTRRPMANSTGT